MSDNKTILSCPLREWGVIFAWIAGIVLIQALLWIFTGNIRERRCIQVVNRILAEKNDPGRIRRIQSKEDRSALSEAFVHWYEFENGEGRAAVFSVLSGGVPASCLAVISDDGKVTGIIPLSSHSARVLEHMPSGILSIYQRNLESGADREKERRNE
jgi:hypothetical protein